MIGTIWKGEYWAEKDTYPERYLLYFYENTYSLRVNGGFLINDSLHINDEELSGKYIYDNPDIILIKDIGNLSGVMKDKNIYLINENGEEIVLTRKKGLKK